MMRQNKRRSQISCQTIVFLRDIRQTFIAEPKRQRATNWRTKGSGHQSHRSSHLIPRINTNEMLPIVACMHDQAFQLQLFLCCMVFFSVRYFRLREKNFVLFLVDCNIRCAERQTCTASRVDED